MDPSTALALLAGSLAIGLLGVHQLAAHRSRRELLLVRAGAPPAHGGTDVRRALDARLRRTRAGASLHEQLLGAGVGHGVTDFLALAVAAAATGYVVAALVLPSPLAVAVAAGAARACWSWLARERRKRLELLVGRLPELARVLSNATSAGLSINAAVALAATELDQPVAGELGRVADELRIGQTLEAALDGLARRVPSREVAVLVSTLVIQQRAGGDVVRALADMAETLEQRKELKREVTTVMAGSVTTAWLVAAMGVGTLLLLELMSPGVLEQMTQELAGRLALAAAALLYAIGLLLVRRQTRIEL